MATIENIKRVLRQLEATGENLEHSSIKSTIGNKFTIMGFGQGICSKRVEVPWSRALLRAHHNSALCDNRNTTSSNSLAHSEVRNDHENLRIPHKKIVQLLPITQATPSEQENELCSFVYVMIAWFSEI
ncbi:hypothetical protein DINM_006862 [Dirofilaria immitis]|nr:hypothetical protein [Dirofilaria immitis]